MDRLQTYDVLVELVEGEGKVEEVGELVVEEMMERCQA